MFSSFLSVQIAANSIIIQCLSRQSHSQINKYQCFLWYSSIQSHSLSSGSGEREIRLTQTSLSPFSILFWGTLEVFQGQPGDIIPPGCPGSTRGSPPGCAWKTSKGRVQMASESDWFSYTIYFSLFCTAQYHRLQICLRGLYNLYTYHIPVPGPHIG